MRNNGKKQLALILISLTFVGLLLFSFIVGFRFFFISSPSMGQTAPVGSLVITYPKNEYREDDIITFYRADKIYTHRIVGQTKDAKFITRGDLNQVDDALPVAGNNIIGSTVYIGKYIGWIWRGLPMLVIGFFIVYVFSVRKKVKESWRWPIRIIGGALTVVIVTFILNPWMRIELLDYMPATDGKSVMMRVVNTGVFPIRDDNGGRYFAGEVRQVKVDEIDSSGRFVHVPRPSLGFWGMILILLWCLTPTILAMTVKLPLDEEKLAFTEEEIEAEKRRNMIFFAIILAVSMMMLVFQISSLAAFAAVIRNSNNMGGTNDYFTCTNYASITSPTSLNPYLAYGFNSSDPVRYDLSGNNRYGTNFGTFSNENTNINSCMRDQGGLATVFSTSGRTCVINDGTTIRPGRTGSVQNPNPVPINAPNNFTISLWFKTNVKASNGKLIGFGSKYSNGNRDVESNDRNLYIDKDGRIVFGVYPSTSILYLATPAGIDYADNLWHHVAVTFSSTSGTVLYIDGEKKAESSTMNLAESHSGYWKIGCGQLTTWRNGDGTVFNGGRYFDGRMRFVAVYHNALTAQQIKAHYRAGK